MFTELSGVLMTTRICFLLTVILGLSLFVSAGTFDLSAGPSQQVFDSTRLSRPVSGGIDFEPQSTPSFSESFWLTGGNDGFMSMSSIDFTHVLAITTGGPANVFPSSNSGPAFDLTISRPDRDERFVAESPAAAPVVVPEPASLLLWGSGALAAAFARRRYR